jgi:predicted nucleic-acid-binding protein
MKLRKRLATLQIILAMLVLSVFVVERNARQSYVEKCQTISRKVQGKFTDSNIWIEKVKNGTNQIIVFGKVVWQLFDKQNDTP